jgi:hypothetical protein
VTSKPSAQAGHPLTQAQTEFLKLQPSNAFRAQEWQNGPRDIELRERPPSCICFMGGAYADECSSFDLRA